MTEQTCVLCNSKLESKEALQDHFRKHANKEIDSKGRPILKVVSASDVKPVIPQSKKTGLRSSLSPLKSSVPIKKTTSTGLQQDIKCDVCEMPFESIAKVISHRWKAHPKQSSKFYCSHCGKRFPLKTILDNHVATQHANIAPENIMKCEDCGEEFFNEAALDYHAEITHKRIEAFLRPVATPPPSKKIRVNNAGEAESVYYCHLCGSEYILKFNLRKHLEVRHADEDTNFGPETEIIRCTICEAIFCNKKAYEIHNMYHQPGDMYVTSEEHRLKTVSRVDQDFDLRRVQIQVPTSVRGLAKHHASLAKMVWTAPFNRHLSNVEPNSIIKNDKASEDTFDSSKSPLKEKKSRKRKQSSPTTDVDNMTLFDRKKEVKEEASGPSKSPQKRKPNPPILKRSPVPKGKKNCSLSVAAKKFTSARSKGNSGSPPCLGKREKKTDENTSLNSKEASNVESSKRVLRSRVSKN